MKDVLEEIGGKTGEAAPCRGGPTEGRCSQGRFYAGKDRVYFCLRKEILEAFGNSNLSLAAIWVKDKPAKEGDSLA